LNGRDHRVTFHVSDSGEFPGGVAPHTYELLCADAWPGKFSHLEKPLTSLRACGIDVVDDLLPQPNWPEGTGENVAGLIARLDDLQGFTKVRLESSS